VRVFKTRWLARYLRRARIADDGLSEAIERAGRGLIDADLGGGLIKQRVAREGRGRSGGYRMLVAYRAGDRAVFLYAFAKNERENIGDDELLAYREIGAAWLRADLRQLTWALEDGRLQEVHNGEDDTADPAG
jgi:hypothetical protein